VKCGRGKEASDTFLQDAAASDLQREFRASRKFEKTGDQRNLRKIGIDEVSWSKLGQTSRALLYHRGKLRRAMRDDSEADFVPQSITETLKSYCAIDIATQCRESSRKSTKTCGDKRG